MFIPFMLYGLFTIFTEKPVEQVKVAPNPPIVQVVMKESLGTPVELKDDVVIITVNSKKEYSLENQKLLSQLEQVNYKLQAIEFFQQKLQQQQLLQLQQNLLLNAQEDQKKSAVRKNTSRGQYKQSYFSLNATNLSLGYIQLEGEAEINNNYGIAVSVFSYTSDLDFVQFGVEGTHCVDSEEDLVLQNGTNTQETYLETQKHLGINASIRRYFRNKGVMGAFIGGGYSASFKSATWETTYLNNNLDDTEPLLESQGVSAIVSGPFVEIGTHVYLTRYLALALAAKYNYNVTGLDYYGERLNPLENDGVVGNSGMNVSVSLGVTF